MAEAMTIFKEGLCSNERIVALETAEKLRVVAKAMGPSAAKSMLIPFVGNICEEKRHEDEVLCAIADCLDDKFLPVVGGSKPTAISIARILANLAGVTETSVRSRAVKSLIKIVGTFGDGDRDFDKSEEWAALKSILTLLSGQGIGLNEGGQKGGGDELEKKNKDEPWFPLKMSACELFPAVYRCLPKAEGLMQEEKKSMLENFAMLCDDEMPMVRAQAAAALGDFSCAVTVEVFRDFLLPIFKLVSEDRSDIVRNTGVSSFTKYLETLPTTEITAEDLMVLKETVMTNGAAAAEAAAKRAADPEAVGAAAGVQDPNEMQTAVVTEVTGLFLKAANDPSWRVRLGTVKTIQHALKPADAKTKGEMLATFADLLLDEEPEVKLASTNQTSKVYAAAGSKDLFEALVLPTVLSGFQEMLDSAKSGNGLDGTGNGGGMIANISGDREGQGRNELRQAQAIMCMELAAFDAIPHPMLVAVVQHMFEDPSLCIKMLAKFELLSRLKETDSAALSQICMDSLSLGVHEDWRVRCAFTAKLSFIFEQIISVESKVAASKNGAAQAAMESSSSSSSSGFGDSLKTPNKGGGTSRDTTAPTTPLDDEAVERAWTAFKSVVDGALWDQVSEARSHFVECLPKLIQWADKIGGDRYVGELITMLIEQYNCEKPTLPERKMSYLYKINVTMALQTIITMRNAPPYFSKGNNSSQLVSLLLKSAAKNPTPNVRLVAAKAIGEYGVACCGGYGVTPGALQVVEMSLIPTLQTMSGDADEDAKFYAQMSLSQITEAMSKTS